MIVIPKPSALPVGGRSWFDKLTTNGSLRCFTLILLCLATACAREIPQEPTSGPQQPPAVFRPVWNDPDLLFLKARRLYEEQQYALALIGFKRITEGFPKSEITPEAMKLAQEIEARLGEAGFKIGLLLPLSGKFARFGNTVLKGVECAFGIFDPCQSNTTHTVQLVVKDTRGSGALAAHAIGQMVRDENVAAIIGPLLSAETDAAATQAQALNIPMVLLAPKSNGTTRGDFIFQHTLLPSREVAEIVRKGKETGIRQWIALYPRDRYGERYFQLFSRAVQSAGGSEMADQFGYDPNLPDFEGILQQFKNRPGTRSALQSPAGVGIFIPDSYRTVAQIAKAFDKVGIGGVRLVGTSRWHHPDLLKVPAASLEGALIGTPFAPESPRDATQFFTESFRQAYGEKPAWLNAIGYDTARIVLDAIQSTGSPLPAEIQKALSNMRSFPGSVGRITWDANGTSRWPLDFITVRNGMFVSL